MVCACGKYIFVLVDTSPGIAIPTGNGSTWLSSDDSMIWDVGAHNSVRSDHGALFKSHIS